MKSSHNTPVQQCTGAYGIKKNNNQPINQLRKKSYNMKKLIFALTALLSLMSTGFSQQTPLSSTYFYNKFTLNPALTGIYQRPQLYLVHRDQWMGLPGNPVTNMLTVEAALKNDKIGLGAVLYSDDLGITNTIGGKFSYAYRVKLAQESYLGLGLQAGISRLGVRFDEAKVEDPYDLSIYNFNAENKMMFDAAGGANFNWRKLNIGFSLPNLINTKAKFHNNDTLLSSSSYFAYARHIAVMASYELAMTSDGKNVLTPSVLLKRDIKQGKRPMQIDVNLMYDYMKKYMAGVAYRTDYGIITQLGIKLFDQLTVGYAYDFNTNKSWKGSSLVGQTHEIILGFEFAKNRHDIEKRINKLDTSVQESSQKVNDMDSTVRDTKKKMEKMNNDLRKRDDDNFQNLKKEMDKMNGDIDEIRKMITTGGGNYSMNRIYFKSDRSELLPGSITELNELEEVLTKYPNMNIKVMGYADITGGEDYNQRLSERRAKAVYDYLVSKGIRKDRLEYEGYGKKLPVADDNIPAGRQLNRRVQIKVTKF
jgi:type IX secretion system PorP/SprF family membrane protein